VTITGSGFIPGESATPIRFGQTEAVGVNCTSPTECSATTPGIPPPEEEPFSNPVDVTATVNGVASPHTAADHFDYHGLYLVGGGETGRLRVGESVKLNGFAAGQETNECYAFVEGRVASNGQTTDVLDIAPTYFPNCFQEQFFGELPFSFALRLADDGSATIEGPMGVRTGNGCVYEGSRMAGSFENTLRAPLNAGLSGTFTLVAEEKPGAGCAATESVGVGVATQLGYPSIEPIG
jgi:hypothetical protein